MNKFCVKYDDEGCTSSLIIKATSVLISKENNCVLLVDNAEIKFPMWNSVLSVDQVSDDDIKEMIEFNI